MAALPSSLPATAAPAAAGTPALGFPGRARGNGVATLVLRDVVLVGVNIGGATDPNSGPEGRPVPVVRLRVGSLREASSLELARPFAGGSLRLAAGRAVPSGGRAGADVSARGGVVLDATWACVRDLGVTDARLLEGLLDGPLNEALDVDPARGFRPTWATELANLVGLTPVPIVVDEFRAEVAALDAESLRLPGTTVVRDERAPAALAACSSRSPTATTSAQARRARTAGRAAGIDPQRAVDRLRRVPRLRDLPPSTTLTHTARRAARAAAGRRTAGQPATAPSSSPSATSR